MEKWKLTKIKNLLQHICVFFLLYNPPLILNLNTASFDDDDDDENDDHYYYCYHHYFISSTIIIIIIIITIIIIFLLRKRVFLTGVWLFDIHFVSLGKPFIFSRPSNGSAVLLLSFFLLFVYLFCQLSLNPFSFFYSFSFTFSCRASGEK